MQHTRNNAENWYSAIISIDTTASNTFSVIALSRGLLSHLGIDKHNRRSNP